MFQQPGIGVQLLTYSLTIPLFVLYSLILAGCTSNSPGLSNLHLVELGSEDQIRVRGAYYGMCVLSSNGAVCVSTAFSSKAAVVERLYKASPNDPIPDTTVDMIMKLQTGAFINVLQIGTFLFSLSLLSGLLRFYNTKRNRKGTPTPASKRRQNFYRQLSLALAWAASAFTLAAAVASTQTGHAIRIFSNRQSSLGEASIALHWITWVFTLIFCYAWTMMLRTRSGAAEDTSASGSSTGFNDFTPASGPRTNGGVVSI
ncbi:hypothetical protein CC86DRAFT_404394 [Ophiobolus disseminans]|uniref:Uncharacterized protein n=1 Tax=Ophiobolus disseminans TaxID=1469910 RepID=A0A6A7A5A9_9PLEO|nr:hypothetical protein CC86DRAFT_404394 [Ophiobolus disseminans]